MPFEEIDILVIADQMDREQTSESYDGWFFTDLKQFYLDEES